MKKKSDKKSRWSLLAAAVIMAFVLLGRAEGQEHQILLMMPEIPQELVEPRQRANYLALHYWDKFDFRDTVSLMKDNLLERSFVDFIEVLSIAQQDTVGMAFESLLETLGNRKNMLHHFLLLGERYLYEANSPVCNDEQFVLFLQAFIQSPLLGEAEKIRPQYLLESAGKNRMGTTATDFTYTLQDGATGTLHGIQSEYILLYFNDPGCDDCNMLTKRLIVSSKINALIAKGILQIMTVYTFDNVSAWQAHSSSVLHSWIYTRDAEQAINMEGLYNIKRFPTLYLLDKDKTVLLKDTTLEKVEKYFNDNGK